MVGLKDPPPVTISAFTSVTSSTANFHSEHQRCKQESGFKIGFCSLNHVATLWQSRLSLNKRSDTLRGHSAVSRVSDVVLGSGSGERESVGRDQSP